MKLLSTQSQRNIELFLKRVGIQNALVSDEMEFHIADIELYISCSGQKINFLIVKQSRLDPDMIAGLYELTSPQKNGGTIYRVMILNHFPSIHYCFHNSAKAETFLEHYLKVCRYFQMIMVNTK